MCRPLCWLVALDPLLQGQDVEVEVPGDDAAVAAVLRHPLLPAPATQLPRAVTILPGRNVEMLHYRTAS